MKIDKFNEYGDIAFNEELHKYWNVKNPEYTYTSITTLIGKYHEKFNEDFMSSYKALEALTQDQDFFITLKRNTKMTTTQVFKTEYLDVCDVDSDAFYAKKQELLDTWKQINAEACEIGTAKHLSKENEWYDIDKEVRDYLPQLEGSFECVKYDFSLAREKVVIPEYLVYYSCPDKILHLAGQVDLVVKDGNDIYILDYKTNRKGIETKAFFNPKTRQNKKMFYPINNLDDTVMNHYRLQLSIYAWMIQKINPELNIKMLKLIHIDREDNETEFDVPYLKDEVQRLLKYHKKVMRTELFRSK